MTEVTTWIDQALAAASSDECIIIVNDTTEANLRWAVNSLTTNGQMHHRTATVIAIRREADAAHAGMVSGPVAAASDLLALVEQAGAAAQDAPASDDASPLPDPIVDPDYETDADATSIEVFGPLAQALGRAFADAREKGHELFGFAEHHSTTVWLATSTGARRRTVQPMGRIELNAKHADRIGSAWVGAATVDFVDVDGDALYAEVSERLRWCETRIELPAGRYETILPPSAVADLMIYAYWTMNGRDAEEGRNVYAGKERGTTRVGETLSSLPLRVTSGPGAGGLPGSPFVVAPASEAGMQSVFDNGAPVAQVDWMSDGVLRQLVYPRSGARASGTDFAYPTQNLVVDAESATSMADMVAGTKRGLLLTTLWYIREVDTESLLVTGLTRDGVYLVEDGQVVGMVNNFRFNESPIDLLKRATEASTAVPNLCREWNDWFTYTVTPALRIPDFNMSTVSKAY